MLGRAAEAVEEIDKLGRRMGSCAPARVGSLDLERMAGELEGELEPGERSNRSARALTLLETWGGERVVVGDVNPEAEAEAGRGVALGVVRVPFAVGVRVRVVGISRPGCGEGGRASCSVGV